MNGYLRITASVGDDFAPAARLNSPDSMIGIVAIAAGIEVVVYSADEARRYAAAFTRAAQLLGWQPEADTSDQAHIAWLAHQEIAATYQQTSAVEAIAVQSPTPIGGAE